MREHPSNAPQAAAAAVNMSYNIKRLNARQLQQRTDPWSWQLLHRAQTDARARTHTHTGSVVSRLYECRKWVVALELVSPAFRVYDS